MQKVAVFLIGPQGSGKGTQASILHQNHRFVSLAGGDIARGLAKKRGVLGDQARQEIKSGQLLSDQLLNKAVTEIIIRHRHSNLLFDGYPRNLNQTEYIDQYLGHDYHILAIYLKLDDQTSVERLTNRLVCSHCGTVIYEQEVMNLGLWPRIRFYFKRCPFDGYPLIKRADDTPDSIKTRLRLYHQETEPVINYFQQKKRLITVDARPNVEQIASQIEVLVAEALK